MAMIHRQSPSINIGSTDYLSSHHSIISTKFTIKERKAEKRKEKSKVAAQIRRNKESQILILLQNALPLSLPNPNLMLEKSIVIRIAGQTLFLMNTLDQVLGMDGWLTVPLASNNFLTFFMDTAGRIVYASPNIQLLLEHHYWTNIIGMPIYDVVDFKCRWPTPGEVVHLKLSSNPSMPSDATSFSLSSSISQSNYQRTTIASKISLRKNSQTWNYNSSTCSIFNVWCCSSINYTNAKLRLLILQATQMKSSFLNNINSQYKCSNQAIISNHSATSLQRSVSMPSMSSSSIKEECLIEDHQNYPKTFKCKYHQMVSSAHDKYYNFKTASTEFCQMVNESPKTLVNVNLLDIIHIEDVIKVKSILDLIVKNNESYVWTPMYRFIGSSGSEFVVRTLVKQYCTTSSHSLILNHLIIKISPVCHAMNSLNGSDHKRILNPQQKCVPLNSLIIKPNKIKIEPLIIHSDIEKINNLKRKSRDIRKTVSNGKYSRLVERILSDPAVISSLSSNPHQIFESPSNSQLLPIYCNSKVKDDVLSTDPFLPISPKKFSTLHKKSYLYLHSSLDDTKSMLHSQKSKINLDSEYDPIYNRSPSYSMESCVLTSPGSESTDVPFRDQFIWDVSSNYQEITPINYFFDEQLHNDLELILPI